MNSARSKNSSRPFPQRNSEWGLDTRVFEGQGRRVFLARVPRHITTDDIKNHFNGKVEGIHIKDFHATIQFARPRDKTICLMDREVTISGAKMSVDEWRAPINRALARKRSRSRSRSRSPGRDRSSSHRNRSRERDHRRSRSPSSRRRDRSSKSPERYSAPSPSRRDYRQPSSSQNSDRESNSSSKNHLKVENHSPPKNELDRPQNTDTVSGSQMPYCIELCLKLALDDGNFRKFSISQFNDVIRYIEAERDAIYPRAPANNWIAPQIPQFVTSYNPASQASHQYSVEPAISNRPQMLQVAPAAQFQQATPLYNPLAPQQPVIYQPIQQEQPTQEVPSRALQPTPPADERPDETPPEEASTPDQDSPEPVAPVEVKPEQKAAAIPECIQNTAALLKKALRRTP